MAVKETPSELFKRSLAQTTRALAGAEEELEVIYGAEGSRLARGKDRLPHPPRVISDPEAERLRGQADGLALRLALERPTVADFYQRAFGADLPEAATRVKVA